MPSEPLRPVDVRLLAKQLRRLALSPPKARALADVLGKFFETFAGSRLPAVSVERDFYQPFLHRDEPGVDEEAARRFCDGLVALIETAVPPEKVDLTLLRELEEAASDGFVDLAYEAACDLFARAGLDESVLDDYRGENADDFEAANAVSRLPKLGERRALLRKLREGYRDDALSVEDTVLESGGTARDAVRLSGDADSIRAVASLCESMEYPVFVETTLDGTFLSLPTEAAVVSREYLAGRAGYADLERVFGSPDTGTVGTLRYRADVDEMAKLSARGRQEVTRLVKVLPDTPEPAGMTDRKRYLAFMSDGNVLTKDTGKWVEHKYGSPHYASTWKQYAKLRKTDDGLAAEIERQVKALEAKGWQRADK